MDFTATRAAGAVVRYERIGRAHLVCVDCWSRLADGEDIGAAALRRLLMLVVLALAAWLVIGWVTPHVAPNVVAAFWRNGAGGR